MDSGTRMSREVKLDPATMLIMGKMARELSAIKGNLLGASGGALPQIVLVTSAIPGEGKTLSAVAIAFALARYAQARVLLVDADDERAGLSGLYGLSDERGLTDAVAGEAALGNVICASDINGLAILPFGKPQKHSMDLLEDENFSTIFGASRTSFDFMVVDGPSVITSSNVALSANKFDGVVLVIQCESTRRQVVALAREKIERVGGRIIGVVLNRRRYYIPRWLYKLV